MDEFARQHPTLLPFGFAACFVVVWVGVGFILSLVGGWWELAKRYRTELPFPAHERKLQRGQMRSFVGYNVLALASDPEGIYLGVLFLFRTGHPRLRIPWREIEIGPPRLWLIFRVRTLQLGPSRIPLRLSDEVVDFLLAGKDLSRQE